MVKRANKIDVLAYTKLQTIIAAFVGLAAGILYSFGGLIIDILVSLGYITSSETPGLSYGTILAFGALIGMPLYFALIGAITAIIGTLLYNACAKWFKKIDLNIKQSK